MSDLLFLFFRRDNNIRRHLLYFVTPVIAAAFYIKMF